jgi:hypothetical protein
MSVFNSCAHLATPEQLTKLREEIGDYTRNGRSTLQMVLDTQLQLQKELSVRLPDANKDPTNMAQTATCGELVEYLRYQKDLIDDEFRELLTSLGGMSNGVGPASSVWKRWKATHQEYASRPFTELSAEDLAEVQFEVVDILHYIANIINAVGLDADTAVELYMLKNAENINRYKNSY